MSTRPLLSALVLMMLAAGPAHAEPSAERSPLDLALKLGVATGPVTQADKSIGNYGGFPLGAGLDFAISQKFTFEVALDVVADFKNFQVTRVGLDVQLAYHLLGGARRTVIDYGNVLIVTREPYNLSLLLREGLQHYTVPGAVTLPTTTPVDADTPVPTVGGAQLATHLGVQFRLDVSESLGVSLDAYLPVYALPASSDRIKATVTEFVISMRLFL